MNASQRAARRILSTLSSGGLAPEEVRGDMLVNEDLGIGSLKFIRLVLEVETTVGRRIFNVENIAAVKRVDDLYALLSLD